MILFPACDVSYEFVGGRTVIGIINKTFSIY